MYGNHMILSVPKVVRELISYVVAVTVLIDVVFEKVSNSNLISNLDGPCNNYVQGRPR